MAATNSQIESNLEDLLNDLGNNTVEEYQIRNRRVKRAHANIDKITDAFLKLRGLNSSRRGVRPARIVKPS